MSISLNAIAEKFSSLIKPELGDSNIQVTGVSSLKSARPADLVFIPDEKHLRESTSTRSRIWIVQAKLLNQVPALSGLVLFSSSQVQLALALIGREFFPQRLNKVPFGERPIHPSAVIDPSAEIAEGVLIGPNSTIGARVKIGPQAIIGANTTIEAETTIGARTHIHPQVYIAYQTVIGADCEIHPQTSIGTEGFGYAHDREGRHHRMTHYGRVVLEDRVHIGAGVQIDRGTFEDSLIGEGTIIDNQCHFGHNIRIGKGTIVTGGALAAGSVTIGDRCVLGGRTSMAGHLTVTDNCQFAALSGINSSVEKPGIYGGYPLQPVKDALKTTASLPHIPRMRRQLARILKHLGLEAEE